MSSPVLIARALITLQVEEKIIKKIPATVIAVLKLGRLHFLIGGILLYGLGVMTALYMGYKLNAAALLWGQLVITTTQLMTHYANDYFDLEADKANLTPTHWSGGSRVLPEGRLEATTARNIALGWAVAALSVTIVLSLIVHPGFDTFMLLITAQSLAWFYSAPPLRLHSRGMGEITTAIAVTALTPVVGYFLQTGRVDKIILLAVIPLCILQIAMLLSIEFPDEEGDRLVGKRTLVVQMGALRAARLYIVLLIAPFSLLPLLVDAGLPHLIAVAIALPLPLAGLLILRIARGDWREPKRWNGLAFYTITLLMVTIAAELAAFMLLVSLN